MDSVPVEESSIESLLLKYADILKEWGKPTWTKKKGYISVTGEHRKRIFAALLRSSSSISEFHKCLRYVASQPPAQSPKAFQSHHSVIQRQPRTGVVYLIRGGGYCKIGMTSRNSRRLFELRSVLPFDVELLYSKKCADMVAAEKYWHHRFATHRIRGEWFQLSEADIEEFRQWKETAA